jgi:hypothetical protein
MNFLMFATFASLFSIDYLANNLKVIPQKLFLVPEGFSAIAMLLVVLLGISRKRIDLSPKYAFFLLWFILTIVAGLIINHVDSLVAISGFRIYLKSIPFFLLPMVYVFSDRQVKWQLFFLLGLCLTQIPVTFYQRFVQYADVVTADGVGGTLGANTSGVLSVILVLAIAIVVAMMVKKRLPSWLAIPTILALFIPTTINETKIVLLLFPFVIIAPLFFAPGIQNRARKLLALSITGTLFMVGFVIMYDVLQGDREGTLLERFQSGNMFSYMYKKDKVGKFSDLEVGRFDAIAYAMKKTSDTGNSIFGVGIGNASPSNNEKLEGEYHKKWYWMAPAKVMASRTLWEMGYLGLVLYTAFFAIVLFDALALARGNDQLAAFALGWIPITMIVFASFVYFSTFQITILSHLFFFYAGYIAASRHRQKRAQAETSPAYQHSDPKRFADKINPAGTKGFKPVIGQ